MMNGTPGMNASTHSWLLAGGGGWAVGTAGENAPRAAQAPDRSREQGHGRATQRRDAAGPAPP